jgi:hypothetical protein
MTDHPFRTAADTSDGNVTDGGVTETFLDAMLERVPLSLGATETLGDYSFDAGSIPLALVYGKTGYLYFYNADDTTSADDGSTVLVSGDGRRYILADMSAIAIASVLAIENDPPVSPTNGDAYIVDTAPTGAWAAHAKDVALYTPRGWVFATPKVGQALLNEDTGFNVQYSAAGDWGAMATTVDGGDIEPDALLFPMGLSVEARQNAPPGGITPWLHYLVGTSGSGAWASASNKVAYSADGTTWIFIDPYDGAQVFDKSADTYLTWFAATGDWRTPFPYAATCQGRLTTETGVAVSTSDRTTQATLYFTPYKGNAIALYVSGGWALRTFTEKSLSLSGYTTGKPFDIFGYDNAGVLALESLVWTNDTTRATALTTQDGILVKTGDATRRYLGTIYTSATGQTEDSFAKRLVWNYYNRLARPMRRLEGTNTWSYDTATWRQANGSTANQLEFVQGVAEDVHTFSVVGSIDLSGDGNAYVGIGIDSTSANATGVIRSHEEVEVTFSGVHLEASLTTYVAAGRHYAVWLEYGPGGGTTGTWYGDNGGTLVATGMQGTVFA